MNSMFKSVFPRLFQLFQESDQSNKDNFFLGFERRLQEGDQSFFKIIKRIEDEISFLDNDSWSALKRKCLPYVCQNDKKKYRGWTSLVNSLFEAKGYLFLHSQGYKDISFIPESKFTTPDFKGQKNGVWALLEVKCINSSDKGISDLFNGRGGFVNDEISEGFKNKILSTAQKAKSQLKGYSEPGFSPKKLMCLFLVNPDLQFSVNEENIVTIEIFLEQFKRAFTDVDVHYVVFRPNWIK